jgi:hypothetical protein
LRLVIGPAAARVGEPEEDDPGADVWRDAGGAVAAWAQRANGDRWMHLPAVASYRLRPGDGEVTAIPDRRASPQLVVSGYERTVLPMAVQLAGHEVLHASGVRAEAGVVAFCAVSTTGKSTIAARLGDRGYRIWGDDAVAFDAKGGSVTAIPLPFRLSPRAASGLDSTPLTADTPSPAALEPGPVPLAAVCVLERAPLADSTAPVSVLPLSPPAAFPAVLTHAYCYSLEDAEHNRRMVDHYLELSARVPVFSVRFRAGLENLPAVVDEVERAVGMSPGCAE